MKHWIECKKIFYPQPQFFLFVIHQSNNTELSSFYITGNITRKIRFFLWDTMHTSFSRFYNKRRVVRNTI